MDRTPGRAWCETEELPAGEHCYRRGHVVVTSGPSELDKLKGRILIVIEDALESGNVYHHEDALKAIKELVR